MTDNEFVLEALKRLVPDTSWYGESNHDNESIKNIKLLREMFVIMFKELTRDYRTSLQYKTNASARAIAKEKQKIIAEIMDCAMQELKEE